jgi:chitodextrinase
VAVLPNQGPRASFVVSRAGATGLPMTFDGAGSSDSDGTIRRYDWTFGDGTTLPDGGPAPAHVYRKAGAYPVSLTVTDNEGCSLAVVHTGQSALCNGSSLARITRTASLIDAAPGAAVTPN